MLVKGSQTHRRVFHFHHHFPDLTEKTCLINSYCTQIMTKCIVKVVLVKLEQKEFRASKYRLLDRRSSSLTSHLRYLLNSYRSRKNSRLFVQFLPVIARHKPPKITCFFFNMHVFKLNIKTTNTQKNSRKVKLANEQTTNFSAFF